MSLFCEAFLTVSVTCIFLSFGVVITLSSFKLHSCLFFETRSHYVALAGLELTLLLPQPLEFWIIGMHHHPQLITLFLNVFSASREALKGRDVFSSCIPWFQQ
jgi:hypothetical protein